MSYEENRIEFETRQNEHIDAYFEARPQIERTRDKECFVEAGFRMAWYFLKRQDAEALSEEHNTAVSGDDGRSIEPEIIINGQRLTDAQSVTIRAAIERFEESLNSEGLGDDEHGKFMLRMYNEHIAEIRSMINVAKLNMYLSEEGPKESIKST